MVTKVNVQELMVKAESQYEIVKGLHRMFGSTLDLEIEDLYLTQLAVYAELMRQVRVAAPQLIELKLKEVLAEVKELWPEHGNNGITPEVVAKVTLLLDTATALGWIQPMSQTTAYVCEVCGHKGQLGVDIVERPFFDRVLRRDSTRWECRDIEKCLDKIGR